MTLSQIFSLSMVDSASQDKDGTMVEQRRVLWIQGTLGLPNLITEASTIKMDLTSARAKS